MKRVAIILVITILVGAGILVETQSSQALPEYANQTGEPCATCHLSPSGGGSRTVRGQAWVGSGKPGQVPLLEESLELLGINLSINPADFLASGEEPAPAQPLIIAPADQRDTHQWLLQYEGN